MLGGPLHRRVYFASEVPQPRPYRDTGRYSKATLGSIHHNCRAEYRDVLPRVWEFLGEEKLLAAYAPLPGGRGFGHACNYLGCLEPATQRIDGETGRPLFGCPEHAGGFASSMSGGQRIDYRVTVTPC